MPFGLKNAPAVFQRMIDNTLGPLLGSCCIAYMDNILVFSPSEDQHKINLEKVLTALSSRSLVLKRSKCEFFKKKVTFLGSIIFDNGHAACPDKLAAIVNWKRPENRTKLCSFLGTVNFLCCFAPNLSDAAHPLSVMTSTKIPFIWGESMKMLF